VIVVVVGVVLGGGGVVGGSERGGGNSGSVSGSASCDPKCFPIIYSTLVISFCNCLHCILPFATLSISYSWLPTFSNHVSVAQ